MTKEEIYTKVSDWLRNGKLVQRSAIIKDGGYWYEVWKMVGSGQVFFTSKDRIVATDKDVRDEFQRLIDERRVMSLIDVTIKHPECKSARDVDNLVKAGQLMKIDVLSSVNLFVE